MQLDDPESELGRVAVEAEVAADAETDAKAVQGVLSRGSIYSIVTVVQASTTLLAIPLLTRLLDTEEYGLLTAVLVAQAVLTHLAGFGMPSAVTRAYFHDDGPDGARALIGVAAAAAFLARMARGVLHGVVEDVGNQFAVEHPFVEHAAVE